MTFSFHAEAVAFYESREPGLGIEFAAEVRDAIGRAVDHPAAWPVLRRDIRRCQTHRFPYGILYAVEQDSIFVVAVTHVRKAPDYWKSRLG